MKMVVLQPLGDQVAMATESSLLDTLLARNCDVAMACGGQGICATCHVHVREGMESLSPITSREQRTLALMTGADQTSRLACQARILGDGIVVELPEGMYLEAAADLTKLVGRRAETPILHPRDGRILIPKGKIITRSRILELENEDLNVLDLRNNTSSSF